MAKTPEATNKKVEYFVTYPHGESKTPLNASTDAEAKKLFDEERAVTAAHPMNQPIAIRKYTTEDVIVRDVVFPQVDAEVVDPTIDPTTLGPVKA